MKEGKPNLFQRLKDPDFAFAVFVWAISPPFIVGSAVAAALGCTGLWVYPLYACAAVLLGYSVYAVVKAYPRVKRRVLGWAETRQGVKKLTDYRFRTVLFSSFSFAVNLAYALFEGVMGILLHSIWYGSLAAYYGILSLVRGYVVIGVYRRRNRHEEDVRAAQARSLKIYRNCGVSLVVLDLAMAAAVTQMVLGRHSVEYAGLMIFVSATYTFYKVIMAIYNLFKARRGRNPVVQSLRNINLADALISLVGLEAAMLATFGNGDSMPALRAVSGFAVCAATVVVGILMIVEANGRLKRLEREGTQGEVSHE